MINCDWRNILFYKWGIVKNFKIPYIICHITALTADGIMEYSQNLVSIIMPLYNVERFVLKSIAAIQQQTYQNWELIIVDDCSIDDGYTTVADYIGSDARIKLYKNLVNLGSPESRNQALDKAKGQYVAFCDADDVWLPEKLRLQLEFMRRHSYGFTYTNYRRISEAGEKVGHLIKAPAKMTFYCLLGRTAICTSTVILDRYKVGDIYMNNHQCHDFILWLTIISRTSPAYCFEKDLLRYRVVATSYSRNKVRMISGIWRVYREYFQLGYIRASYHFLRYAGYALLKYKKF